MYQCYEAFAAGKAADVKRCHGMRKALALLDFDSESIGDVKRLLLRAAFLPAFLRAAEGRRFLAYLFTLDVSFQSPPLGIKMVTQESVGGMACATDPMLYYLRGCRGGCWVLPISGQYHISWQSPMARTVRFWELLSVNAIGCFLR